MSSYASLGRVGVLTPQANPTVEDEMAVLLPPAVGRSTARLTSRSPDPLQRLRDYLLQADQTLDAYDTLKLDAYGFACTGSSYLLGEDGERRAAEVEQRRGRPLVTAAEAILWALDWLNARRIVVIAPYPQALLDAGHAYFQAKGLTILAEHRIEIATSDTRGIYDLGWRAALDAYQALDLKGVDAVLLSGTGMPSLPVLAQARPDSPPVISSNFCLAARLMSVLGHERLLNAGLGIEGWRDRLETSLAG